MGLVKKHQPATPLGRAWKMGKMGLGVAGSYLGYQLQSFYLGDSKRKDKKKRFQQRASRRVREELQSMKGPAMKLGQFLSMQSHALPEEVLQELAQLQMRAPAMHPTLARSQFRASFGKYPEEVFAEFEPDPFAAASLGQVHRARTKKGERVAVKIQYPAIRQAIENDLTLLQSLAWPGQMTGHVPKADLQELGRGLLEETDYYQEAVNLRFFRERLQKLPFVVVPKVFEALSTDRILTMSHVEGISLPELLAGKPSQEVRDRLGSQILTLFNYQIQQLQALHADPHPGNYLYDREGRIGLVDFGCVKYFSPRFVKTTQGFVDRLWLRGPEGFDQLLRLAWGDQAAQRPETRSVLRDAIRFVETIYPPPEAPSTVVDFGDPTLIQTLTKIWNRSLRAKVTAPEFIFFCRTELGIYNVLHQLNARVDTAKVGRAAAGKLEASIVPASRCRKVE